jgi:radical SAM superfamily enzyme YgiQ (UPF0313 family)
MKILIIETVWMGTTQRYHLFDKLLLTAFSILPTLYARQIAAITPKEHVVTIINERYQTIPYNQHFDLVNINYTTSTAPHAYEIADQFKKKGTTIIFSGMHASALPDEALRHGDSVLLGRGELNWITLLQDIQQNSLKHLYQPIPYDKNIRIPPANIQLPGFVITGAIEATRGCPYACNFCPEVNMPEGNTFYKRPVNEVIEELKNIPQKTIQFYDSSLTIDPIYSKDLFKNMKGLGKRFFANGNADVLANDAEFVRLSKEAGCIAWLIGFESINQHTLEVIGKKTNTVKQYQQAIDNIHKNKQVVIGCFMFGFDSDTKDIFTATSQMIKQLKIDIADFSVLTPFPGTPVFTQLDRENRLLTKDWGKYDLKTTVFQPKHLTVAEISQGLQRIYQDFYGKGYTTRRIINGLRLGFYPFFVILARNMIALMNSRRLF